MAALGTTQGNLGFLTVLQEPVGFLGGYLVTNPWGRPLEFRLSTLVQPNRVQQILYGPTLHSYLCGELIGKTLVEKTSVSAQIILTDKEAVMEMRRHMETPVAYMKAVGENEQGFQTHPFYAEDAELVTDLRDRCGQGFDFSEPFTRIREAIAEARKLGVTNRG